eukprot:1006295-Pyramimonas_sp.AAC.1
MSQAVCLFECPTSSTFGADLEDVSSEALVFAPKWGQNLRMSRSHDLFWWTDSWARIFPGMPQEAPAG